MKQKPVKLKCVKHVNELFAFLFQEFSFLEEGNLLVQHQQRMMGWRETEGLSHVGFGD